MKRAVDLFRPVWFGASWLCLTLASPALAQESSARFIVIDARNGLTPKVLEAYTIAIGGNTKAPNVDKRVRIIASNRLGFNPDPVAISSQVRNLDVDVTMMLRGGQPVRSPISVNRHSVSRRAPARINQSTKIVGH